MEITGTVPQGLSERQQFWLDHITRCDAAGSSTKEYAAAHDLSVQAMYSARKDLVERGALLPGGQGVRSTPRSRFSRVVPSARDAGSTADLTVQLQLRNGTVVGFTGPLDAHALQLILRTAADLS
jgi:hypothetical protein